MQEYEAIFIMPPCDDEFAKNVVRYIQDGIDHVKGKVTHVEKWGTKKLAYPIKNFKEGYYVLVNFEMDSWYLTKKEISAGIEELETAFKQFNDILKFIIVRKEG